MSTSTLEAPKGSTIAEHFAGIEDPRMEGKTWHKLMDIITIALCALVSGAEGWKDMETFGKAKEGWLRTFLELPNGIPSHDTFGRVFAMLSTEKLEAGFRSWVEAIAQKVQGVVAIDGKQLRRSYDTTSGKSPIHMVSAWSMELGLVLGQVKTAEKSNEITAIPELLDLLEVKGCIVSIDAMGCQKAIAQQIVDKEANYVLALKGNQEGLYKEVQDLFQEAVEANFEGFQWDYYETEDHGHGRHEMRRYYTLSDLEDLTRASEWPELRTVGMVETESLKDGVSDREYRFYISSLEGDAKRLAQAVRGHWGIENSLHWVLDVTFREDESRIRTGMAAENFSILRRLALNLLKQEQSTKSSTRTKRLRAAWDSDYVLKLLSFG